MKPTILLLLASCLFVGITLGQSMEFIQDTTQMFDVADVGAMAFGDIDADGDPDLMVTGKGGPILSTLYENDGTGVFTPIAESVIEDVFGGTVRFGDVDGDDDLDLLITGTMNGPYATANLYLNDGVGNFSRKANAPFEASSAGDFAFGDVNQDSALDVIMIGLDAAGNAFTHLYLNDGSGNFSLQANTPFAAAWDGAVKLLDIDQDDDLDVLIGGSDATQHPMTALYLNDGLGGFSLVPNTPFAGINQGDVAIGDTDNDGYPEVLLTGTDDLGQFVAKFYLNDGTGSYNEVPNTGLPGLIVGESTFADFDLDGDLDLLHVGSGEGGLINNAIIANIYENQGNNQFVQADSMIGAYLSSTAIADVDGDGDLDVMIAGTSTGSPVRATRLFVNQLDPVAASVNPASLSGIKVFPNPSQGQFTVEVGNHALVELRLFSLLGQEVFAKTMTTSSETLELNQVAGVYLLTVSTKEGRFTQKLILE